jgi:hypothetical protein
MLLRRMPDALDQYLCSISLPCPWTMPPTIDAGAFYQASAKGLGGRPRRRAKVAYDDRALANRVMFKLYLYAPTGVLVFDEIGG